MNINKKFSEIEMKNIKPTGWVKTWLKMQAVGLTGNMEAAGYPFDTKGWQMDSAFEKHPDDWWPFEQTGYWVDGALKCGLLINNKKLKDKALKQIEYALTHPDKDGYIGPAFMKKPGNNRRWAHAVFFRSLFALDAAKNKKFLNALVKHYKSKTSPHTFQREVCNIEIMFWLYEKTNDKALLQLALTAYKKWIKANPQNAAVPQNLLSSKRPMEHGVSFNEFAKLAALAYIYSGDKTFLAAAENGYKKLAKDMTLINGVCLSTEHLDKVKNELASCETCNITDMSWALGYLFQASGDGIYCDWIEKIIFNALPGAVKSDNFGAVQYFSSPNQSIAVNNSNHNFFFKGHKWMSYRPNPGTECCPGNANRAMPNFAARQWHYIGSGKKTGIAATLLAPGEIRYKNTTVTCITSYPFDDNIVYKFHNKKPEQFNFAFRIPGWCENAEVYFNGQRLSVTTEQSFMTIKKTFTNGDELKVIVPSKIIVKKAFGGVFIEKGALVYSLKIDEKWSIDTTEDRQTKKFPAWNLTAKTPWNYALDYRQSFEFCKKTIAGNPWTIHTTPVYIKAKAYKVKAWHLERVKEVFVQYSKVKKVLEKRNAVFTPRIPKDLKGRLADKAETIVLVPMGATHLRITVFPYIKLR